MNKALLDTDIFSELLKQKNARVLANATAYLQHHPRLTISVLTVAEVVAGYRQAGRKAQLSAFTVALAANEVVALGPEVACLGGEILGDLRRTGQSIGVFDPMIAAVAIANGLTLVTGNTQHFERIASLGYALALDNWRGTAPA